MVESVQLGKTLYWSFGFGPGPLTISDYIGYDRNRIIRPEPEFWFRFAGTGFGILKSGSGIKNRNWHFGIPVPVQKNRN